MSSGRVAVVEDHTLFAAAVAVALGDAGFEVVTPELTSPGRLLDELAGAAPDIVLLDLGLGSLGDGAELIVPLAAGGMRVIVVSGTDNKAAVGRALDLGAVGWVSKTAEIGALLDAIATVAGGGQIHTEEERQQLLAAWAARQAADAAARAPFLHLTRREAQVLAALVDGVSVDRIAARSYVSVHTVRTQVQAVLTKLGVNSQLEAVAAANRAGWQPPPEPEAAR